MKQNTLENLKAGLGVVGVIALIGALIALVIFFPIFTIWSLNLLFATGIPVTFYTWLSVAWLTSLVAGTKIKYNKD